MKEETNRRTVDELKKRGITQIGNTQSKRGKLSFDLFGFLDMVYFRNIALYPELVGVQACWAGKDYDDHLEGYLSNPGISKNIHDWLLSCNKFEFWVWSKQKKVRGGKYYTASVQVIPLTWETWEDLQKHYKETHNDKD